VLGKDTNRGDAVGIGADEMAQALNAVPVGQPPESQSVDPLDLVLIRGELSYRPEGGARKATAE
jgi:hypothetical protein